MASSKEPPNYKAKAAPIDLDKSGRIGNGIGTRKSESERKIRAFNGVTPSLIPNLTTFT